MDSSPNQNTDVQNLEDSLYQGFLNVIARKNAAQRMMNLGTSTKDKRKQAIVNAVNKLQANLENFPGGVENYSATQAFTDAANTNKKRFGFTFGGRKTRKSKKTKKSKKSKKSKRKH